ncbi:MAG: BMC domain-containing protein [Sarcina sp.]
MKSFGIIEVVGQVAAVTTLDAMSKTANVEFKTMENKLGGRLVTIIVIGNIDDVQNAVEVGEREANRITKCVAKAVIARPHFEIEKIINKSSLKYQ